MSPAGALRFLGLLLVLAGGSGCTPHARQASHGSNAMAFPESTDKRPLPLPERTPSPIAPALPPGEPQPGQRIAIPHQVQAGTLLQGQVPAGSRLEIDGQPIPVNAKGGFRHRIPADARGALELRLFRQGQTAPMALRVDVTD